MGEERHVSETLQEMFWKQTVESTLYPNAMFDMPDKSPGRDRRLGFSAMRSHFVTYNHNACLRRQIESEVLLQGLGSTIIPKAVSS